MTTEERSVNLAMAREQLAVARELSHTLDRVLKNAQVALYQAAERGDVYGDAIEELQARQSVQGKDIEKLQETEKHILASLKGAIEP